MIKNYTHVMTVRVKLMADGYGEIDCWIEKKGRKICKNQGNPFLLEILSEILNVIFILYFLLFQFISNIFNLIFLN